MLNTQSTGPAATTQNEDCCLPVSGCRWRWSNAVHVKFLKIAIFQLKSQAAERPKLVLIVTPGMIRGPSVRDQHRLELRRSLNLSSSLKRHRSCHFVLPLTTKAHN